MWLIFLDKFNSEAIFPVQFGVEDKDIQIYTDPSGGLGFGRFFQGEWFKGSVNPEILKNIACCNFLIITVMYIKVYISGMEMSQRIHFWYQILPKCWFFEKMAKKSLFW